MATFYNGMPAAQIVDAKWQRSTYSSQNGNCVELAELPTGDIAMRNSRDPQGSALIYTRAELEAFVSGVKGGEFDLEPTPSLPPVSPRRELGVGEDSGQRPTAKVGRELASLAERIGTGDRVLDQTAAEKMLRVLGAMASLHDTHRIDGRGRCLGCHPKGRFWQRSPKAPNGCSVRAALDLYIGRPLTAASENTRPKFSSSML